MALFDDAVFKNHLSNFKGYVGNPPINKAEYEEFEGWKDKSLAPSWETISAEIEEIRISQERSKQYPSIAEQLDMLWHAIDSGKIDKTSQFYKSIKVVKEANPK